MHATDTGKDKVKKICEILRRDTLDPAKLEADKIVERATEQAALLIQEAKAEALKLESDAKKRIEEEKNVFQASLSMSAKQSLSVLRKEVEDNFFSKEIEKLLQTPLKEPSVVAKIISAVVSAVEKDGLQTDMEAIIPKTVKTSDINALLAANIKEKLSKKSVSLGEIAAGAQVKLVDSHLTIELSDDSLKVLLANFVRDDFRKIIFNA